MTRLITVLLVVGMLLVPAVPASAHDQCPVYLGAEWTELVRRAFEVLPNLGPIPEPGPITGSNSLDDRIWDIAFERGYEMRPSPSGSLVSHEGFLMQPHTAKAWENLQAAARAAGHDLVIESAHRSVSTQRSIFNSELEGTSDQEIDSVLQFHAPPGASRHHTGYALDIKVAGGTIGGFRQTDAFDWISASNFRNAKRFGFVPSYPQGAPEQGPRPEAWEYVYVSRELILASNIPLIGDWTGNGIDTPGTFIQGHWVLKRSDGGADIEFDFGNRHDLPVVGDWDGDGVDTPGVVRGDGRWFLRDSNTTGVADLSFYYGNPRDDPFAGDWDNDGADTPGLHRRSDGKVYLRNSNTQGVADVHFLFGNPGDVALPGDFDGDGRDTVSLYRPSEQRFHIINRLGSNGEGLGAADYSYVFGNPGDTAVSGDYDGDGVDSPGVYRTGTFFLRNSNSAGAHHLSYTGGASCS